jgi:aspartyl-tRNA(Asn)/glutamyl-tRNA(Gln) amidotransferase subunit A
MRTIAEIHAAYRSGAVSPRELVQEYLERIAQSTLNAFVTVTPEKALEQADAAARLLGGEADREALLRRFPLLGIPVGLKDNLVTEGVRTTCASRMLEHYVPPYSATVVKRLEAAGAVLVGKLSLDEFSMGGSNENSAFGPVEHPTHPGRVPGGSSGGPAAAVRAGLCVAALGSDTGGSIRLPASFCGISGLKPTYGTVSRYGLVAFASSLDQVGPLASCPEDLARIMEVIGGHDPLDSTSLPAVSGNFLSELRRPGLWNGLRIGVPAEFFGEGIDPGVESAVRAALAEAERRGARLVPVSLPTIRYSIAVYYLVAVSEASSNLARYDGVRFGSRPERGAPAVRVGEGGELAAFYENNRGLFGPEVKRRILLGTYALSSGYYDAYFRKACQVRRLVQQDFERVFETVDLLAGPVSGSTAFRRGERASDPLRMYLNDGLTVPANLAGLPALSVPCGEDADGLPVGLQLLGPAFSDARLLAVADAWQSLLGRNS